MVLTQPRATFRRWFYVRGTVSIPLWFLRNETRLVPSLPRSYCFHTTMVLTQQNHGCKSAEGGNIVSIPLWFLRNVKYETGTDRKGKRFHTTMVLTQHTPFLDPFLPTPTFPYHYGSYATSSDSPSPYSASCVSIPLWFLRNRFYYKDIIQVLGRQNQPTGKIS